MEQTTEKNVVAYAQEQFQKAWDNPAYTQIELDDVDVNAVLSAYYEAPKPVKFTGNLLWDMEKKKAWNPALYISHVVKEGSSWGLKQEATGNEYFVRSSAQKQWLTGVHKDVFEEVYLNNNERKVTFLGVDVLKNPAGEVVHAKNDQPLFHVEHSVKGTEENPLNGWRIVFLTEKKDQKLLDVFKPFNNATVLPRFIEVYITHDMQIPLTHK